MDCFNMMWMPQLPDLCKMAPCMSGCCVNLGLFATGIVCLLERTRQMCWHVFSAMLQASKYISFMHGLRRVSVDYKISEHE